LFCFVGGILIGGSPGWELYFSTISILSPHFVYPCLPKRLGTAPLVCVFFFFSSKHPESHTQERVNFLFFFPHPLPKCPQNSFFLKPPFPTPTVCHNVRFLGSIFSPSFFTPPPVFFFHLSILSTWPFFFFGFGFFHLVCFGLLFVFFFDSGGFPLVLCTPPSVGTRGVPWFGPHPCLFICIFFPFFCSECALPPPPNPMCLVSFFFFVGPLPFFDVCFAP